MGATFDSKQLCLFIRPLSKKTGFIFGHQTENLAFGEGCQSRPLPNDSTRIAFQASPMPRHPPIQFRRTLSLCRRPPQIEYVSVAGKHRKGAFFWEDPAQDPDCNGTRFEKFIVGAGYWTVCGTLEVCPRLQQKRCTFMWRVAFQYMRGVKRKEWRNNEGHKQRCLCDICLNCKDLFLHI